MLWRAWGPEFVFSVRFRCAAISSNAPFGSEVLDSYAPFVQASSKKSVRPLMAKRSHRQHWVRADLYN